MSKLRKNITISPSCHEYIKEQEEIHGLNFSAMVEQMILEHKNQSSNKEVANAINTIVSEYKQLKEQNNV